MENKKEEVSPLVPPEEEELKEEIPNEESFPEVIDDKKPSTEVLNDEEIIEEQITNDEIPSEESFPEVTNNVEPTKEEITNSDDKLFEEEPLEISNSELPEIINEETNIITQKDESISEELEINKDSEPKLETKEELDEFTKLRTDDNKKEEDVNIPEWLK
jgi:hypothetical protein